MPCWKGPVASAPICPPPTWSALAVLPPAVGGQIAFPDAPPIEDDVRVAFFTERGNPAEVVTVGGRSRAKNSAERTVTLTQVDDTQPIIRIEIRRADEIAVALGPRLAAVA
jgi:hypothetical protein